MVASNMKPRDIQRAVKVQRFDRAAGDAPSLGPLERVAGTGLPQDKRRKKKREIRGGRRRDRKLRRKVIVVWSAVFAGVSLLALGGAVGLWLWPEKQRADEALKVTAAAPVIEKRVVSRFKSPSQEEAVKWVKQALLIRDPGAVAEFFHLGSASPAAVAAYLRDMEGVDGPVTSCVWQSSVDANELLLDEVIVNTEVGGKPRNRLAFLTPDATGHWKIDFDAFARTVKPAWSEIMSLSAGQALVRVYVGKDTYYNGPFQDEARWSCYGMASPDEKVVMLGYCRQKSPQAAALERILTNGSLRANDRGVQRATLEIRRVEGAESRQFEIMRVLAEDWVISATPFDENFP